MRATVIYATAARYVLVLIGLAALAVPARAETFLTPHSAKYNVKVSVVGGELTTRLNRTEDGRYVATHTIRPTGMSRLLARGKITETSEFFAAEDGIRPDKYRSVDTLSRDRENVDIQFDWASGEARGTVNDVFVVSVMDAVAHDRVSIQYELMHDLISGEPSTEYVLFDVDRLKTVTVRNVGLRTIKVPAGKFEAIGIQHQTTNSKRTTTLWCVKELDYLPVLIEQHKKGKLRVRAVLNKYTPESSADMQHAAFSAAFEDLSDVQLTGLLPQDRDRP